MDIAEQSKTTQYYFTSQSKHGFFSFYVRKIEKPTQQELTDKAPTCGELVNDAVFHYPETVRTGCVALEGKDGLYALLMKEYPGNADALYSSVISLKDTPSR